MKFFKRAITDFAIGIIYVSLMSLIQKLDTFSFAVGCSMVTIWRILDIVRGEK